VMSCWVNLFTFIFQHMIPFALKGHVTGSDLNVAVHTDHVERDVQNGIQIEEDGVVCTSHSKNSRLNSLKEEIALEKVEEEEEEKKAENKVMNAVRNKPMSSETKESSSLKGPLRPHRSFKSTFPITSIEIENGSQGTQTSLTSSSLGNAGVFPGKKYASQDASVSKPSPLVMEEC
jgi:hypothetical protein